MRAVVLLALGEANDFAVNINWVRSQKLVGGLAESSSQAYLQQLRNFVRYLGVVL